MKNPRLKDSKKLADEFERDPFGSHSPELHDLLVQMRSMPIEKKHLLVMTEDKKRWLLAIMTGTPLEPRILDGVSFTSPEDAERFVFQHRLASMNGASNDDHD